MKRLLITIVLLCSCIGAWAQTDTSFWFAFPNYRLHEIATADLAFYSFDQPADVHVEYFDLNTATGEIVSDLFVDQTIPPNAYFQTGNNVYYLDTALCRTVAIHATSSVPITSVLISRDYYTLKGSNGLGTHFLVPAPKNSDIISLRTCIEILATEDHTQVHIDPAADLLGGTSAHSPLDITLQRGQVFYAFAASTHPSLQLGGSIVTSNHPIAVNITADSVLSVFNDSYSTIGEQLVPTRLLGTQYMVYGSSLSQIAFYPLYDSTQCSFDNVHNAFLYVESIRDTVILNRDNDTTFEFSSTLPNLFIFDKPVAAFVTTRCPAYFGHFAGTEMPRMDCSGSTKAVLFPNVLTNSNGYLLYTPDSTKNLFTLASGDTIPDLHFSINPKDSTYVYSQFQWPSGFDRLLDPTPFQLACTRSMLDSLCGCTHTILTDYARKAHLYFNMEHHYCLGDTIFFKLEQADIDHFQITGPNGFANTETDSLYLVADTLYTGWYHLTSSDPALCSPIADSIYITIHTPTYADIFDSVIENQLPWQRYDTTFLDETDTLFVRPTGLAGCDSTIHYHLHIYRNIFDTIDYYACEGELPITYEGQELSIESIYPFEHTASHGEDSTTYLALHIIPWSDTTIYDSILESQLPWFAYDTIFNDTIVDYLYHTYNEAGCDSLIRYNLYIYWEGDHCDTSLTFGNVVTPNGDGFNDKYVIGGLIENNCFKYNELTILDRWGVVVYHKRNIASDDDWWDPAADHAPTGTYFFLFKAHGVNIHTQHAGVIEVLNEK